MTTTTIAVYGSLRAGGTLADLIPDDTPRLPVTIAGRLYAVAGSTFRTATGIATLGGYPTLDITEAGTVHAELVTVDRRTFAYLDTMERGAGYDAATVTATDSNGNTYDAIVWWQPPTNLDTHITTGDWLAHTTKDH